MGERQLEQSPFQPEFKEKYEEESQRIDEIYRLKNQKSDLQAELDCLSVDQEGNKDSLAALRKMIVALDAKIKQLEGLVRPA